MRLYQKIIYVLLSDVKTTREIRQAIPEASLRCLAATISNYPELFVRIDRGAVGLRGRDELLVRNTSIVSTFALYKKIVNVLTPGALELQRVYAALPDEKQVSIRATICMRKDIFLIAGHRRQRIVGRRGRDEYLLERSYVKEIKEKNPKPMSITMMLREVLAEGPKPLRQICALLPHIPVKSITCKLSLHFEHEEGYWRLPAVS